MHVYAEVTLLASVCSRLYIFEVSCETREFCKSVFTVVINLHTHVSSGISKGVVSSVIYLRFLCDFDV